MSERLFIYLFVEHLLEFCKGNKISVGKQSVVFTSCENLQDLIMKFVSHMRIENSVFNIYAASDPKKKIILSQKYLKPFKVKISCLENTQFFKRKKRFFVYIFEKETVKSFSALY